MKILVTGGAGFIGSNFIRYLLETHSDIAVVNYDKLTYAGNQENLREIAVSPRYQFVYGDVADGELVSEVLHRHQPNMVVNFAAETNVARSVGPTANESKGSFVHSNIAGTHVLLESLRRYRTIKKFVQLSTYEVYGSLAPDAADIFSENTPLNPQNIYAATKAAAEHIAKMYYERFGLPIVIARLSTNFGPFQHPEKLIPNAIRRLLMQQKIVLNGDGSQVRDWLYVVDTCVAVMGCLEHARIGEIYNIGADNERSNLEIARTLLQYFSRDDSWIEFLPNESAGNPRNAISSKKIQQELGWKPTHTFEEALTRTVEWYREHREWLERALERKSAPSLTPILS